MTQYVNVQGVGLVGFPDDMTREQIAEVLKTMPIPAAPTAAVSPDSGDEAARLARRFPAPAATARPESFTSKVLSSPVGGVIRGLRDIPDAGAQLLTRGLEAIAPAGSQLEQFARQERQRVEDINRQAELEYQRNWRQGQMMPGEIDVGRVGGNILGTLIPASRAVTALGATTAPVRAGAITGTVGGALQPVTAPVSTEDFMAQKVEQMGAGAGLGAAGGYVGGKISDILFGRGAPSAVVQPPTTAGAQVTATTTPTATATGGGMTPGMVGPDPTSTLTAAQRAILARGKELGFRTTPGQETGSRALQQMEARLESSPFTSGPFNTLREANQRVLNRATAQAIGVNADELSNPVLAQAQREISKVYSQVASPEVKRIDGTTIQTGIEIIDNAFEGLTTQPLKNNIFVKQLQELAAKGEATGSQLQTLSSKIGKRAKNEMTTAMGDRELGSALFQIKEMVDDALAQGLSAEQQAAFRAARENYRNLMTLRTNSGVINPSSGNVSGLNLANALTRKDPRGFMFGENQTPMYEAARFAQAFKPIVGDSGTATRMMEMTPLNVLLSAPTNIAASAYTSAPSTALASRMQSGLLPQTDQATQEMLRRMFPQTGAAGLISLIGQ